MENKKDYPKIYWHLISQPKINMIVATQSIYQINSSYSVPVWCKHPCGLDTFDGCKALTDTSDGGLRTKVCERFCQGCKHFDIAHLLPEEKNSE